MNFKKMERYLRVNLLGPGPRLVKKGIYRAAVSQRLRNTSQWHTSCPWGYRDHVTSFAPDKLTAVPCTTLYLALPCDSIDLAHFCGRGTLFNAVRIYTVRLSGRAVPGVGLRPLACWDCGFESHRGHGYLSVVSVVCCQVKVSATSRSLFQRSPTDCDA